jgi:hypothetical protein
MTEFRTSRAGARNVAGVNFQALATAWILLSGIGDSPVLSVIPEGEEDIDVLLGTEDAPLYVQVKFRSGGLSRRDLAQALVKAWEAAVRDSRYSAQVTIPRTAVVANTADFAGLSPTGWDHRLHDQNARSNSAIEQLAREIVKLRSGEQAYDPQVILGNCHLVQVDASPQAMARAVLSRRPAFNELQADLAWSQLVSIVLGAASNNRDPDRAAAEAVTAQKVERLLSETALAAGAWLDDIESERILLVTDFESTPAEDRATYLRGVRGTAQHVAAGYAIERPRQQATVSEAVTNGTGAFIVGQSGGGKSTLMWQVAASLGGYKCYTLTRVQERDVAGLLRLLQALAPSRSLPILLCIDDFDDEGFSGWGGLIEGLKANPNIRILGTCREEHFDPSVLAGVLRAIRPPFEEIDAFELARALRLGEDRLTAEESAQLFRESRGLMLEFVYMAVTSRRLSETLEAQAYELAQAQDELPAVIARIVLTADLCGITLSTTQLTRYATSDKHLAAALAKLAGEHILLNRGGSVRGLHALRSTKLVAALHSVYPPIANTLTDVMSMAPIVALPGIARLWVSEEAGDLSALALAVSRRLEDEPNRDWDAIAQICLEIEAIGFMPDFARALPADEYAAGPGLLISLMDGRGELYDGFMYDSSHVLLSPPLLADRANRMTELTRIFDALPLPFPFRTVVVAALRARVPLEPQNLTVSALAMLRGSDCFSAEDLIPFVKRLAAASSDPDPGLRYEPWRTWTAQLRLSRAWSAKACAGVARIGENGLTAIKAVIGASSAERAVFVLLRGAVLLKFDESNGSAQATLLLPQAMLTGPKMTKHIRSILEGRGLFRHPVHSGNPGYSLRPSFRGGRRCERSPHRTSHP